MNCRYRQNEWLDEQLPAALRNRAADAAVSADLDERVFQSISRARSGAGRGRAGSSLRLFSRKIMVAFCALFCLSCAGVMAAGSISGGGWVSHAGQDYRFSDFAQAAAVAAHLDYTPQYVESLGGFAFAEGHITYMQRLDENGQRMSHIYQDLYLEYADAASGESLTLVTSIAPQSDNPDEASRQFDGITVFYKTQPYKFVPADYELSAADRAGLADGSLEISVGTDKVEQTLNASLSWTQDGVHYLLFGWDLNLSEDEMFALAADFISQTAGEE